MRRKPPVGLTKEKTMRSKIPMYALDKVEKKFAIKVNTFLKLEARVDANDEKRKSVSAIVNDALDNLVRDDDFTPEMMKRAEEIMHENLKKREAAKAKRKGE